jgi:uncharacterized protein YjbJ (UPF0337 family)
MYKWQRFKWCHERKHTGDQDMNWDRIEGGWCQAKGKVRQTWGHIVHDENQEQIGRRELLAGRIQARYGESREVAERAVDQWLSPK